MTFHVFHLKRFLIKPIALLKEHTKEGQMKKIVLIFLALVASCAQEAKQTTVIGVGGPLTGSAAQFGQAAKKGFDLALEEINAAGGVHGRGLEIDFQDDQADPKQALVLANKFIANPNILVNIELLNSPSMAVAPRYQKAGLALLGIYTIHPDFTPMGDYIFSNAPSQMDKRALSQATYAKDLHLKKVAVFSIKELQIVYGDLVVEALRKNGIHTAIYESYLPDEKDFRSLISKAKSAGVDGIVLVSLITDAVLLVQQIRHQNLSWPIVGGSALSSGDKFPQLAGNPAEGVYIAGDFSAEDPRPEVVNFVKKWQAKYPGQEVDYFSVHAYDSIILIAQALKMSNGTRASVKEALTSVKDVPSVIYGKVSLNPHSRLNEGFLGARLIVKNGKVVRWNQNQVK